MSPDGRTLLSVGDSPDIYLHRIIGGSRIAFTPISKLSLSSYINTPSYLHNPYAYANSAVAASFSTAFSANGSKFAVASQEGVVVVWDVRSTKPLKIIQTDKTRRTSERTSGNGSASGWLADSPWDWSRGMGNAPGWGVRSVKFSPNGVGKEVMVFTEVSTPFCADLLTKTYAFLIAHIFTSRCGCSHLRIRRNRPRAQFRIFPLTNNPSPFPLLLSPHPFILASPTRHPDPTSTTNPPFQRGSRRRVPDSDLGIGAT